MDFTPNAARDDDNQFATKHHLAAALYEADAQNYEGLADHAFQHDDFGWNQHAALVHKKRILAARAADALRDVRAIERVCATLPAAEEITSE